LPSNWACPHPWNTSFFVNAASVDMTPDNVAVGYDFTAANDRGPKAPPMVAFGRQGGINGDLAGEFEGCFPYPNSCHLGKVMNVLFCDGSVRPSSENIDGKVWARLVTPNGEKFSRPSDGLIGGEAEEDRRGRGFTQRKESNLLGD